MENVPDHPIVHVPGRQAVDSEPIARRVDSDSEIVAILQDAFGKTVSREPALKEIIQALLNSGLTFGVLGGWVRDQLLQLNSSHSETRSSKDIDLVVLDTTHSTLERVLPSTSTRTLFGGFTFSGEQISIDLWGANDTYLTNHFGIPSDLEHVLAVTDFNINAVVFVPSQASSKPWLLDGGALSSLASRNIEFHFEFIAIPIAQVARLLILAIRLDLSLGDKTKEFIRNQCKDDQARAAIVSNLVEHHSSDQVEAAIEMLDSITTSIIRTSKPTLFFSNCIGVFQGGGVRATAFAGAYQAAVESGVAFSALAGTSAGSFAAALIATGAPPDPITEKLMAVDFKSFLKNIDRSRSFPKASRLVAYLSPLMPSIFRNIGIISVYGGLYSSAQIHHWLNTQLRDLLESQGRRISDTQVRFRHLPIPLYVVAADITSNTYTVFSKDRTPDFSVAAAVRASCSIPFFFQPVQEGSSAYVDGGTVSNLPSFIFDSITGRNFDKYSPRVLGFKLVSNATHGVIPSSIVELGASLANTIVDGASDIQQKLQPEHHTVSIDTGSIRATDFKMVGEEEKLWLFKAGHKAVADFFKNEINHIHGLHTPTTFVGRDQQMLLFVRSLSETMQRFVVLDKSSHWLYLIFPAFLAAARRGVCFDYITTDDLNNDQNESYRRRLLSGLGARIHKRDNLSFKGFLVDPELDTAFAALSHQVEASYEVIYQTEETRTYSLRTDPEVMRYLIGDAQVSPAKKDPASYNFEFRPCQEDLLFERLRTVPQYRNANFEIRDIYLDNNVQALQIHVKEFKFLQIDGLVRDFTTSEVKHFLPQQVVLCNGMTTIITPPVLEEHGNALTLIEGHTRALHCLRSGKRSMRAVVVTGVNTPLPAKPQQLGDLTIASRTLTNEYQYDNINTEYWRPIEVHVHPVDDGI